jgi:hypothetical protein
MTTVLAIEKWLQTIRLKCLYLGIVKTLRPCVMTMDVIEGLYI